MFSNKDNVDARDRRDDAAVIMARRAGACANPIAPEQRAHNEVANFSQLPQRPDSVFNMKSNLELSLEASSPTSYGSYEPQDLPAIGVRPTRVRLSLLRWLESHGPEPDCHLNHSLCPATCTSHSHGTGSTL